MVLFYVTSKRFMCFCSDDVQRMVGILNQEVPMILSDK